MMTLGFIYFVFLPSIVTTPLAGRAVHRFGTRPTFWASLAVAGSPDAPRQALHAVYDALMAAADFYALRNQHRGGFDYPDASSMYRALWGG